MKDTKKTVDANTETFEHYNKIRSHKSREENQINYDKALKYREAENSQITSYLVNISKTLNEYINKKQSEVYETEYFEHTIKFTETILPTEELISSVWELIGDIPLHVKLDGLTLKGNIEMLQNQTIDVPRYPKEKIKPDK